MWSFHRFLQKAAMISAVWALTLGCGLEPTPYDLNEDGGTGDSDGDSDTDADTPSSAGCEDPNMIDDMEDEDGEICATGERLGSWNSSNDESADGIQDPAMGESYTMAKIVDGRGDSHYAAHSTGSGFTDWGAVMYTTVFGGKALSPFDASDYAGIKFFARSKEQNLIKVKVRTVASLPESSGGTCVETTEDQCYDSHARPGLQIGTEWDEYTVRFSEMNQEGWGPEVTFKKQDLMGVEFHIPSEDNTDFDLWIDDLRFF